jgi:hypothetical protein
MAGESLVKLLQIAGAALGIPAAAAGTFAAYQNYFSTDVTCQKLRTNIVATMERNVAPETKRSLLRKDVHEFDKLCGDGDPDARTIFHAAIEAEHPATAAAEAGHATTADAGHATAAAVAQPDSSNRRSQLQSVGVFGSPAVGVLGTAFQRIYDLGHVAAAARHRLERADDAAGLVRAPRRNQRSDQDAEPASDRRLRARAVDARRNWSAVGRGRSVIMLVSMRAFARPPQAAKTA